jgi:hypothetical protein
MSSERSQTATRVLMIRPTAFARDGEAALTNAFMNEPDAPAEQVQERAKREFDALAGALKDAGVEVLVFEDDLRLPDSIFPNNWLSFHEFRAVKTSPMLITYPMCAESRRKERRTEILDAISRFTRTTMDHLDLSELEKDGEFLEGTGSLVLDRTNAVAYACVSGRTTDQALDVWSDETGYQIVRFHAADSDGNPVYHTNVIMSMGESLAVVCMSSITDPDEYDVVENALKQSGRVIMRITFEQVEQFCGNILQLKNHDGESFFAMSQSAWDAFTDEQQAQIESIGRPIVAAIPTIEHVAGGSVRCMIAELGNR